MIAMTPFMTHLKITGETRRMPALWHPLTGYVHGFGGIGGTMGPWDA